MLQASTDCIRLLDLDGCVQFMNEAGKALLEIDDFDLNRGRYWPDVSNTQSRNEAEAAIAAALDGRVHSFRSYFPTAKGTPKWWDTTVAPVFDANRAVVQLLATSRDVTAEVEMRIFLDAIIQVIPNILYVKAASDGRYVLVNRKAAEAFGVPPEQMIGKTDHDFFPSEQADAFRRSDLDVIATGAMNTNEEVPITVASGELRYFRTKKVGVRGFGGGHLMVVAEDVTEVRANRVALTEALERAEAGNRAKDDFLANMSHEIRTPLNGVTALADLLARSGLSSEQRELARLIEASGQALTHVLSDILDLVQLERGGGVKLDAVEFDLAEIVRGATEQAEVQAAGKGLEFEVAWRHPPGRAIGDPARLRQILDHLVTNAVKFTARGRVGVTVIETPAGGHGKLRLQVRDTGIGFSEAQGATLFDAFHQADGSLTRLYGGSGAGLAICGGLVEQMGGSIQAEGKPGEGACFTLDIPLRAPAEIVASTPPEAEARVLRVLLAEDHPTNRKIVELILRSVDADLVTVENGQLAVEAYRDGAFDVVLMDMQMPVMDGLTAVRLIREHERSHGLRRTPVICVTANAMPQHVAASRAADVDLHLAKPITADQLLGAIDHALQADADGGSGEGAAAAG